MGRGVSHWFHGTEPREPKQTKTWEVEMIMRYPNKKKTRMYSDIDSNDSTNRHCMDFNVLISIDYSTRSELVTVTM